MNLLDQKSLAPAADYTALIDSVRQSINVEGIPTFRADVRIKVSAGDKNIVVTNNSCFRAIGRALNYNLLLCNEIGNLNFSCLNASASHALSYDNKSADKFNSIRACWIYSEMSAELNIVLVPLQICWASRAMGTGSVVIGNRYVVSWRPLHYSH